MRYVLTQDAKKDVRGIWNYTFDKWGREQADRYHHRLESCFEKIAQGELSGRKLIAGYEDVASVRCQHHYVFFLVEEKITIIAILHEKMDFTSRLVGRLGEE